MRKKLATSAIAVLTVSAAVFMTACGNSSNSKTSGKSTDNTTKQAAATVQSSLEDRSLVSDSDNGITKQDNENTDTQAGAAVVTGDSNDNSDKGSQSDDKGNVGNIADDTEGAAASEDSQDNLSGGDTGSTSGDTSQSDNSGVQGSSSENTGNGSVFTFVEGTYAGSTDKRIEAMSSNIHYDIVMTLSNGSYTYTVNITVSGGQQYSSSETYEGTYTVNGSQLSMTGKIESGTASDGALTVTGHLSSFAGSTDSVTLYN